MRPSGLKLTIPNIPRRVTSWSAVLLLTATLGVAATPVTAIADPGDNSFTSFEEFLADVSATDYGDLSAQGLDGEIAGKAAFKEMRGHILNLYDGVKVRHSFVYEKSYYDCVVTGTQPTLNKLGESKPAAPPAPETKGESAPEQGEPASSMTMLGKTDKYGNDVSCAKGTIPMRRVTLDQMSHFATLSEFLAKRPDVNSDAQADSEQPSVQAGAKHYAFGDQPVNNRGGNSVINVWNPNADFSLSQQWFSTGSGSTTQTVEGGWVKYPAKFGASSALFIYYTPDGYSTGCYNLECGAFVQISSNWSLGGPFDYYSTLGGEQRAFYQQWKLYNGNWWFYLRGPGNVMEPVGYYPTSVFRGGQMATTATSATFGGEVELTGTGWPPMGSGQHASAGFTLAAYQNTIFYIGTDDVSYWSSLNTYRTSSCYSIAYTPASSGGSWGTYLYFGGPSGNC